MPLAETIKELISFTLKGVDFLDHAAPFSMKHTDSTSEFGFRTSSKYLNHFTDTKSSETNFALMYFLLST